MTDSRFVAVARGRQGGFSTLGLPGAVQYAGVSTELVIYYPNTPPPLTTVAGITTTDLFPSYSEFDTRYPPELRGAPGPYDLTTFQGVNALQAPNTNNYYGPFWGFDFTDSTFNLGSGPFTLEFWWRLGTSLPGNNSAKSAFVDVRLSSGLEIISIIIQSDGGIPLDPPNIRLIAGDFDSSVDSETIVSNEDATSFNHLAIQRHNATDYTVHYKGQPLKSWSRSDVSFSDAYLEIAPWALNVPGTSISQIRLSRSARYGTGPFFTPFSPFYAP
jgi:hypothetical protein